MYSFVLVGFWSILLLDPFHKFIHLLMRLRSGRAIMMPTAKDSSPIIRRFTPREIGMFNGVYRGVH